MSLSKLATELRFGLDEGEACLEPLENRHADGLLDAAGDESIWTWLPQEAPKTIDEMRQWIDAARANIDSGLRLPMAIVYAPTRRAIGSTSYLDVRPGDRNIEIGWTWITPAHQRSAVNTECKLMLLTNAFETLAMARVCLKTDALNTRSRRAIERLGASFEGVIRSHVRTRGGRLRDSAYYSILEREWPEVKRRLESMRALKKTEVTRGR